MTDDPRCRTELAARVAELKAENARLQKLELLAVLVATAFRLRDEDALILTLRRLAAEVDAQQVAGQTAHGITHEPAPFDHTGAPVGELS